MAEKKAHIKLFSGEELVVENAETTNFRKLEILIWTDHEPVQLGGRTLRGTDVQSIRYKR